jgi:hypothetical protein
MMTKGRSLEAVTDKVELERLVLAHTPRFLALLDAAHDRIKKGGGVKHEDFWKTTRRQGR